MVSNVIPIKNEWDLHYDLIEDMETGKGWCWSHYITGSETEHYSCEEEARRHDPNEE